MSADDKKYQVFVSSTYEDLKEERKEVIQALLELDCIPSGMELFPAADEDQWSLIKGVIDDCDYYVIVVGGRYGSLGPNGTSYTEMEYRYALEQGKPILGFLHADPAELTLARTEADAQGRIKLEEFRELVRRKACKMWRTPQELGSVVSRGIVALKKRHPATGWIRADRVISTDAALEILKLRNTVELLQQEIEANRTKPPEGSTELAHGDIEYVFDVELESSVWDSNTLESQEFEWEDAVPFKWNELFFHVSPMMIREASEEDITQRLVSEVRARAIKRFFDDSDGDGHSHHEIEQYNVTVSTSDLETVLVQFQALGYIVASQVARSGKSRANYWTLTPYGRNIMFQLRAVPASTLGETVTLQADKSGAD